MSAEQDSGGQTFPSHGSPIYSTGLCSGRFSSKCRSISTSGVPFRNPAFFLLETGEKQSKRTEPAQDCDPAPVAETWQGPPHVNSRGDPGEER